MTNIPLHSDPFGAHDPWIGPGVEPGPGLEPHDVATVGAPILYTGADALTGDIDLLPTNLNIYGSYVDNYKGYDELAARFGKSHAFLVSITIFGNKARCADVEPGAMNVTDLPHWLDNVTIKDEYLPWVYTSAGNMAEVNKYIGNRKVVRWSAHYGHGPHVCGPSTCGYPQADWTQWADVGAHGENIDRSVGHLLPHPQTPPKPNPEYQRYQDTAFELHGEKLNERNTVKHYDQLHAVTNPTAKEKADLAVSKVHLLWLAERVYYVAHHPLDKRGKPTWDQFYRGFRYQGLIRRAHGKM